MSIPNTRIYPYEECPVGGETYTWENDADTWGDYRYSTTDPFQTGETEYCKTVIRKRWKLVEVTHLPGGR